MKKSELQKELQGLKEDISVLIVERSLLRGEVQRLRNLCLDQERRLKEKPSPGFNLHPDVTVKSLMTLIRYLARTYGENDPIFVYHDLYGNSLPENVELARTWFWVVREWDATRLESLGSIQEDKSTGN